MKETTKTVIIFDKIGKTRLGSTIIDKILFSSQARSQWHLGGTMVNFIHLEMILSYLLLFYWPDRKSSFACHNRCYKDYSYNIFINYQTFLSNKLLSLWSIFLLVLGFFCYSLIYCPLSAYCLSAYCEILLWFAF